MALMALSRGYKGSEGISPLYVSVGPSWRGKGSDGHKTRSLKPEQAQEQARILRCGKAYEAYLFAHNVPDANILALQTRVLAVGSPAEIHQFALTIPAADRKACQAQILEAGTGQDAVEFASEILGADVAACQERVLTVGDGRDAYTFALRVPDADIAACQARVLSVGSAMDAFWFGCCIPGLSAQDVEALYAHAQARGFEGLDAERRSQFDARLAECRAQRQQDAGQIQIESGDCDAGTGADVPTA